MPYSVYYQGKRYATNAKPMEKLQVLVKQVCRQAKCESSSFNGQLFINGSKADLDLPVRLANIPSNARIEVKTALPSRLGISSDGASPSTQAASTSRIHLQQPAIYEGSNLPKEQPVTRKGINREASSSKTQAPALASGEARADDSSRQSTATPSKFATLGLDREVLVFSRAALEAAAPSERVDEPPDSFYEFGVADYAVVMKGYSRSTAEAEKGLRTAKMREQEDIERANKHPHTIIRIECPDGFLLQMKFKSLESIGAIKKSVQACLLPGVRKWQLHVTPPKQVLSDNSLTIYKAKLCPAAKLYFRCEAAAPFLRPEILALESQPPGAYSEGLQAQNLKRLENENLPGAAQLAQSAPKTGGGEKKVPKWMKVAKK